MKFPSTGRLKCGGFDLPGLLSVCDFLKRALQVLVTVGATEALAAAFLGFVNQGDEVSSL